MEARPEESRKPRGLIGHCGDFLRWLLLLALVTAAVCSFGMYFIHSQLDQEIRLIVLNKFQSHYSDLIVRVRSAHLAEGRGIEVRGLSISEPSQDGRELPLLYIEELFAECPTELADLAAGNTRATRLVFRGTKLRAIRLPNDRWNIAKLFPPPKFGDSPPPIELENSTLEIIDLTGSVNRILTLDDIALKLTPLVDASIAAELDLPPSFRIEGSFAGDHLRQVHIRGNVNPNTRQFELTGAVQGLETNAAAIDSLPGDWATIATPLRSATGLANFTFALAASDASSSWRYSIDGKFSGRIEDSRLPQPLMNVNLPFELSNDEILVRGATAQAGPTKLQFAARAKQLSTAAPFSVRLKAEHVVLDNRLADSLPPEWRVRWDKFNPRGIVDSDITLQYDGERTFMSATADLLDTSFAYHKLPYRIHQARGQVRYNNGLLEVDRILGLANGVPVLFDGKLNRPDNDPTGWFRIRVDQPLPIDAQLIDALPRGTRQVVQKLNPRHGKLTANFRFDRPSWQVPPRKQLEVQLAECSMQYERFRYPLYGIRGTLKMDNDVWTFTDLEGHNDSAFVVCQGGWRRIDENNSLLDLSFDAFDVPLEDELRNALPDGAQAFWRSLRPRGTLDHLEIGVRYQSMAHDLSVTIDGLKRHSEDDLAERITIKPTWLPYQLDEVVGVVRYDNGIAELQQVQGRHGNTAVQLSGRFDPLPDDRWQFRATELHIDRLRIDHELVPALPEPLAQAVSRLKLSGPLSVSGTLGMQGDKGSERPKTADWSLDFDVEDGTLDFGVRLEHLRGSMQLAGSIGEHGHYSRGQFDIDSLFYNGLQLTEISGPLSVDDRHLAFGEAIRRQQGEQVSRPLKAKVLGGVLVGSGKILLDQGSTFELDGELFDADLATIVKEFGQSSPGVSGRAFAQVHLTGAGTGTHKLRGNGSVQLRDADIYELPVMVRLLKLIRVKTPDETAFTTSDMAFTIEADRLYFKQLDFAGDAVNLRGRGEMTFDREIDLVFQASVLAHDSPLDRLVRPFFGDGGGLLEVPVTGTLDEPQFPRGVNQAIQQVFPESERRNDISRLPPARGAIGGRNRRR